MKLNMISYLGFPIVWPNGKPFGAICVLDNKENEYSGRIERLILKFRDLIQRDLDIIYMNRELGDKYTELSGYIKEIKALRGLVPICPQCKNIKDEKNTWHPIEHYLLEHSQTKFSHTMCPKCMNELYPGFG